MKAPEWVYAALVGVFFLAGIPGLAQDNDHGNGQGHGRGHDKHHNDEGDDRDYYYKHHERDIYGWYSENQGHLPPGLAK